MRDLHWLARRYAHGRSTYVTSLCNRHVKALLAAGVPLHPTGDQRLFADDAMGRAYDGLTPADRAAEQAYCRAYTTGRLTPEAAPVQEPPDERESD